MTEEGYLVSPEMLAKLGKGDSKAGRRALRAMIDLEIAHEPINDPTEKPLNVRAAVEADEEAIMRLIREDIAENASRIAPLDEDHVRKFLKEVFAGKATIGVIDSPNGGLSGMIAIQMANWWWGPTWALSETFCYTKSDERSITTARDLIKFSRWFADEFSARVGYRVFLLSGVTATHDAHAKVALYRRLSNYVGSFFIYPSVS